MNDITIALSQDNMIALRERIYALAPHARIITREELSEHPQRWAEIDICYGAPQLKRGRWRLVYAGCN